MKLYTRAMANWTYRTNVEQAHITATGPSPAPIFENKHDSVSPEWFSIRYSYSNCVTVKLFISVKIGGGLLKDVVVLFVFVFYSMLYLSICRLLDFSSGDCSEREKFICQVRITNK